MRTAVPLISTSFNDHPIGIPGEIQRAVDSAILLHASTLEQRPRKHGPPCLDDVSKSGQAPFNRYGGCREGATDQRRKRERGRLPDGRPSRRKPKPRKHQSKSEREPARPQGYGGVVQHDLPPRQCPHELQQRDNGEHNGGETGITPGIHLRSPYGHYRIVQFCCGVW